MRPHDRTRGAIRLFVLLALLAGTVRAADDASDKIRLLSVDVQPSLLILGEVRVSATARIALRPTDGLDGTDAPGKSASHSFFAELKWEFFELEPAVVSSVTTAVVPPHRHIQLPADPQASSGPTEAFIEVQAHATFDGRLSTGAFLPAGQHAYRVRARFWRRSDNPSEQWKLVGETGPRGGSLLVSPRPAPPSIDPYPTTTNYPILTLSGGAPAGTFLMIDGVERVALGAETTWSTTKTLVESSNSFRLSDRTAFGVESSSVTVNVTLVTKPPPPPVVSVPQEYTSTRTVTLTGTKVPGSGIIVNGNIVVVVDDSSTWTATVQLEEGANSFIIETVDAVGNKSLAAGSHVAGVAEDKPVIRDLEVSPAEISAGQTTQIRYRLFAATPFDGNGDFRVSVRVEDGDLLVKELFSGVQRGNPTGPEYTASWNATNAEGRPVIVNTSYRLVVSGVSMAPTTRPRELVDPNFKESAVLVVGSQHVKSADGKLEIILRPDDARLAIQAFPALSPRAGRLLTSRALHPQGGCYRISVDRPFAGAAMGVLRCPDHDGRMLRPFVWADEQQDWAPVGRANWNPTLRTLSFVLPGPGLVVFATTDDVDQPYLSDVKLEGGRLTARVRDDTSGVDTRRVRVRQGAVDLTGRVAQKLLNGVHDVSLSLDGVQSLDGVTVYAEDWAAHGRLFLLGEGKAP